MACFLVSATVGVGAAVACHIVKHHENKLELEGKTQLPEKFGSDVKWSQKLAYLELTLFSGSFVTWRSCSIPTIPHRRKQSC